MFGADTMAMINAVLPFFLMGGIFYFMLWKPQKKQQQERQNLLNSLKKGDKIISYYAFISVATADKVVVKKLFAEPDENIQHQIPV